MVVVKEGEGQTRRKRKRGAYALERKEALAGALY